MCVVASICPRFKLNAHQRRDIIVNIVSRNTSVTYRPLLFPEVFGVNVLPISAFVILVVDSWYMSYRL